MDLPAWRRQLYSPALPNHLVVVVWLGPSVIKCTHASAISADKSVVCVDSQIKQALPCVDDDHAIVFIIDSAKCSIKVRFSRPSLHTRASSLQRSTVLGGAVSAACLQKKYILGIPGPMLSSVGKPLRDNTHILLPSHLL